MKYLFLLLLFISCTNSPKFSIGECATERQKVFHRKIIKIDKKSYTYILSAFLNPEFKLQSKMNIKDFDSIMTKIECN